MPPNKTVLITGGGRGIGAAISQRFIAENWRVIITYAQDELAGAALARAAPQGCVEIVKCDLRSAQNISDLFTHLDRRAVYLDAVINNAGVTGSKTALIDADIPVIEEIFTVNALGPILVSREALRRMSTARGGRGGSIVNISSTATKAGSPHQWVHYAAAKGAVDVFTRGLAAEVAEVGVRVNAVAPGLIINDPAREAEIQARFKAMRHEIPIGRPGLPSEVAAAVFWLCSDEASYVTGAILPVSGGR